MSKSDSTGAKINENTWVEKMDHTGDTPVMVERITMRNGAEVKREVRGADGELHEQKETAEEKGNIRRQNDHEVAASMAASASALTGRARIDPWRVMNCVVKAAQEVGLDVEVAGKFMAALSMELQKSQIASQPVTKQ